MTPLLFSALCKLHAHMYRCCITAFYLLHFGSRYTGSATHFPSPLRTLSQTGGSQAFPSIAPWTSWHFSGAPCHCWLSEDCLGSDSHKKIGGQKILPDPGMMMMCGQWPPWQYHSLGLQLQQQLKGFLSQLSHFGLPCSRCEFLFPSNFCKWITTTAGDSGTGGKEVV